MREILFRGKKENNGEWVEGDLTKRKYEGGKDDGKVFEAHIVLDAYEQGNILNFGYRGGLVSEVGYECFRVDPKTVCQYTGLTDKNGMKIFENDIIECRRKNRRFQSQIEWDPTCGGFMFQDTKEGSAVGLDALLSGGIYNDFEVIGNIFDNPDLVENNA